MFMFNQNNNKLRTLLLLEKNAKTYTYFPRSNNSDHTHNMGIIIDANFDCQEKCNE